MKKKTTVFKISKRKIKDVKGKSWKKVSGQVKQQPLNQ